MQQATSVPARSVTSSSGATNASRVRAETLGVEQLNHLLAFKLGDIEIDPQVLAIRSPRGEHRIPPKHMSVLVELMKYAPAMVSRGKLLKEVWPRGCVDPAVLGNAISSLRRTFAAHGCHDAVETVPRRGYRLTRLTAMLATNSSMTLSDDLSNQPWPVFDTGNRAVLFARGVELNVIATELAKQMMLGQAFVLIRVG